MLTQNNRQIIKKQQKAITMTIFKITSYAILFPAWVVLFLPGKIYMLIRYYFPSHRYDIARSTRQKGIMFFELYYTLVIYLVILLPIFLLTKKA